MIQISKKQFCRLVLLLSRSPNTNIKINKLTTSGHLLAKEDKSKPIFTGTWQFPENQNQNQINKINSQFKKPLNKQVAEEIQNLFSSGKRDGKEEKSERCLFDTKFRKGTEGPKGPEVEKKPKGPEVGKEPKGPEMGKGPKGPEVGKGQNGPEVEKGPRSQIEYYYQWTPKQHEEWTDRLFGDLKELARQKKEGKKQGRNKTTESKSRQD